ncbi:carbohydrate ABC transporter permease [Jiangella sp. DSM 45060]|uniref:carbohydrate ABC transporter permease n=1 Tax=Jiangella sp. DSM 45060 TaxID=1798224 RepID=UPI00087D0116|nr:sugar ABC transporter permease [Jiangella sp. DSM 45060]SDT17840.1 raffinose/stachyose/melibiose transport system permease protein [Jiangella sp. DSM 45060]
MRLSPPSSADRARWRRGGLLYVAPALVLYLAFVAWPVLKNLQTSFLGNTEFDPSLSFVGLDNYRWLVETRASRLAFRNVLIFGVLTVPVQMVLGLLLAVALRGRGLIRGLLRTLLFLPVVLTPVVIGYLFADLLETTNGSVNTTLRAIGLDALAHPWLADPATALPVVAAVNVWMWTGFSMAIYQAAITGLDDSVLEAAALDGASRWQTLRYVVAPMLRPAHYALLILGVIGTLKTFDLVYVLTRGGPDHASEVPTSLLLTTLLNGRDGRAAALGTAVFVLALVMTVLQLRRYLREESR